MKHLLILSVFFGYQPLIAFAAQSSTSAPDIHIKPLSEALAESIPATAEKK
jgi:hypothetical protein